MAHVTGHRVPSESAHCALDPFGYSPDVLRDATVKTAYLGSIYGVKRCLSVGSHWGTYGGAHSRCSAPSHHAGAERIKPVAPQTQRPLRVSDNLPILNEAVPVTLELYSPVLLGGINGRRKRQVFKGIAISSRPN